MEHQNPGHRPESTKMPRWVKLTLAVLAALAVLVTVALLSGHRPAQHGSAAPATDTAAVIAPEQASAAWL